MKKLLFVGDQQLPDASDRREAFYFVVGVILNQQISGERAWQGVASLAGRIDLTPKHVAATGIEALAEMIARSPAVHPFTVAMATAIQDAGARVLADYDDDARNVWRHCADKDELVKRLTRFRQVGNHKARVAEYLLTVGYGEVPMTLESHAVDSLCPSLGRLLRTTTQDSE